MRHASHLAVAAFSALSGLSALSAPALAAQDGTAAPIRLEGFAARKESSSEPIFGGAGLSFFSGPFGIRFGGGLHFGDASTTTSGFVQQQPVPYCDRRGCRGRVVRTASYGNSGFPFDLNVSAWTADADLVLEPFRQVPVMRSLLLGFSPYGFVGIGHYYAEGSGLRDTSVATWSYGVGLQHQLVGILGLSAEARARRTLNGDSAFASTLRRNVEYRVGFTLGFGGGGHASRRASENAPPPPVVRTLPRERDDGSAALAARVLDVADGLVDTPYRSGGGDPNEGFDAGGFVQYVFGKQQVQLPRDVRELAEMGRPVSTRLGALRPGDLLFFSNDGGRPDHVAIYAGRERIIHATASGGSVRYDVLGDGERGRWFLGHLVSARRVLGTGSPSEPRDDRNFRDDNADRAPRPSRPAE